MFDVNDISILEELLTGNVKALEACYTRYRTELIMYAYSILEDEAESQDVVQEFFIDFWQKQLYLSINSSIKGFLYISIKNRCLNKLRSNDVRRKGYEQMLVKPDYELPSLPIESQQFRQQVSSAIAKQAPMSSEVFQLAYFEQLSREEIANKMGISPGTVKNQITRALKILRKNFIDSRTLPDKKLS